MKKPCRYWVGGILMLAAVTTASASETAPLNPGGSPPPPLVFRPDSMIRADTQGKFSGNDLYNQSGVSQTVTTDIARGETVSFTVRLQNDGNTTDSFLMKPGDTPSSPFAITYWKAGINVTPTVTAGKFSTGELVPGQSVSLVVKVFAKWAANKGSVAKQSLTLVSQKSPDIKDTVALRVKRGRN